MSVPIVYLTDSASGVWQLGVSSTPPNVGAYTITSLSGPTGVAGILLKDTVLNTIWALAVYTDGAGQRQLRVTSTTGLAQTGILILSPANVLYQLVVTNGKITVVSGNPAPPPGLGIVTGTFKTPDGTPVNGYAQFKLSHEGTDLTIACFSSQVVKFPVVGGSLTASVIFNDVLAPGGSAYHVTVKDNGWGQVWNGAYSLTSGTANLNTLLPVLPPSVL